ncbi:hypothetical protein DLAC_05080 [Tieghemostelium lacteum]|uniref:Uncharacterized protein n=1 Tax=Tieghemostelium lacteum TaxID=361077 RepID=A0A151ZI77_TIELA|nr:hypothetical protein DLAC_05080 [Tieghemostelium lacteum]|eukprot:KYQ93692.1 hypothetical protein DLAC_05080 [Tieghemostelium lacteum]
MSVYDKTVNHGVSVVNKTPSNVVDEEDDWDSDPNYTNDISEKSQRWGSKLLNKDPDQLVNIDELRKKVSENTDALKEWESKKILYGGDRAANNDKN